MKKNKIYKVKELSILFVILTIGAFLRLWLSDFKPILLDYDAFYHARIAGVIYDKQAIPFWDLQELGGVPHYYPPVFHVLIVTGKYMSQNLSFIEIGSFLNVFFGVISILIVYLLARERFNSNIALVSAWLFAITPIIIFRTGLWARPTGLAIFLAVITAYAYLRLLTKPDMKNGGIMLLTMLAYLLSHSSFLILFAFLWIVTIINYQKKVFKVFLSINFFIILLGILYYYKFIPYLNFSLGYTLEYEPMIRTSSSILRGPFDPWALLALILFLSTSNLSSFPFLIHGIFIYFKEKQHYLGILTILGLLLVFFKGNLFILFIFALCIAIGVSLREISKLYKSKKGKSIRYGWSLAILLLLLISSLHGYMYNALQGEKVNIYVEPMKEVLTGSKLTSDNLVLANDITIGHGIAYYSNASTFMSVLTDTKRWSKNYVVYERFYENLTIAQATSILMENDIDHLLIINQPGKRNFPFIQDLKENLTTISETWGNNITVTLYKIG